MYRIFVNGNIVELEKITVSAHPFNRTWPGKQRDPSQSETAYMVRCFGEGKLDVVIETKEEIKAAVIRPLSKNIALNTEKHKISFSLPANGKYAIEINGVHHAIHLLYQKSVNHSDFPKPTYWFKKGHYNVGLLKLKNGETVCIEKDAVVHGSLLAVDAKDITIYGDGILCGDWEERTERHGDIGFNNENIFQPEDIHTCGGIRTYRCNNISISGITVTDTASYAISFFATDKISIENVNVLGLWKYNCDGIDFFNSSNITVKDCFVRSFDDSMCMKGLTAFSYMNTENAHISNSVFWCDWGKNFDIGVASACKEIKNIVWENCDIIHNSSVCIAISNGQWADVHDIVYKNINIEYAKSTEPPIVQSSDEQVYESYGSTHVPILIDIHDSRRNWQGNISYEDDRTKIRNILIDNINVRMEQGIDQLPSIQVAKINQKSFFENISIQNVFINGKKQKASKFPNCKLG